MKREERQVRRAVSKVTASGRSISAVLGRSIGLTVVIAAGVAVRCSRADERARTAVSQPVSQPPPPAFKPIRSFSDIPGDSLIDARRYGIEFDVRLKRTADGEVEISGTMTNRSTRDMMITAYYKDPMFKVLAQSANGTWNKVGESVYVGFCGTGIDMKRLAVQQSVAVKFTFEAKSAQIRIGIWIDPDASEYNTEEELASGVYVKRGPQNRSESSYGFVWSEPIALP